MEKNITVKQLVENYNKKNNIQKEKYINETVKSESYISYVTKIAEAKRIVESTSYIIKTDETGKLIKTGIIKINSPIREMLRKMTVINLYTNIEIDTKNQAQEYDALEESGLLKEILSIIPPNELETFGNLVIMECNDFYQNNMEVHNFITETVGMFTSKLSDVLVPLLPVLTEIGNELNGLDEETAEKIGNKVVKIIDKMKK